MKDFIQRQVLHNFGLKLISLVLAIGLWLTVSHSPVADIALEVPVMFRNVPANLQINPATVPRAQIWMSGPERLVRGLQPSEVRAEIDLAGAGPGLRTFALTPKQVHRPYGIRVDRVVPGQLRLEFTVTTEITPARQADGIPR